MTKRSAEGDRRRLDRLGGFAGGVLQDELGRGNVAGLGLLNHGENNPGEPFAGDGIEEELADLGDLPGEGISGTAFVADAEPALRGALGLGLGRGGTVRGGHMGVAPAGIDMHPCILSGIGGRCRRGVVARSGMSLSSKDAVRLVIGR